MRLRAVIFLLLAFVPFMCLVMQSYAIEDARERQQAENEKHYRR